MQKMYTYCPNLECQAQWGIEEISFQECDACGYPNVDNDDRIYDNDDDDDIEYDDYRDNDDWNNYEPLSVEDLQALGIPISDDPTPSV